MIEQLTLMANTMLSDFIALVPNLVAAILILLIGFGLGKVLGKVVEELVIRSKLDKWLSHKEKINFKLSSIANLITRWLVYLVFIEQATIFLGILAVQMYVANIISFIPGLIGAGVIIIVGYLVATYLKDHILSGKNLYSAIVGKIVFFLLLYFSIAMALPFIGVNTTLVNMTLMIILASFGLGMAIAMGLGFKEFFADLGKTLSRKVLKNKE